MEEQILCIPILWTHLPLGIQPRSILFFPNSCYVSLPNSIQLSRIVTASPTMQPSTRARANMSTRHDSAMIPWRSGDFRLESWQLNWRQHPCGWLRLVAPLLSPALRPREHDGPRKFTSHRMGAEAGRDPNRSTNGRTMLLVCLIEWSDG